MIQKREIFTGNMDLKNYEILGMKKGQIDINIKKRDKPKARLFQALSMDPRPPPDPHHFTCMMFFCIWGNTLHSLFPHGHQEEGITSRPICCLIAFFISVLVRDGAAQTKMQSRFTLLSPDNHLSRKHLFKTSLLSLPVWGYWSHVEPNRYDCTRFLFLFQDFILNYVSRVMQCSRSVIYV